MFRRGPSCSPSLATLAAGAVIKLSDEGAERGATGVSRAGVLPLDRLGTNATVIR